MYLFRYLQTEFGLARRKILLYLQKGDITINDHVVENMKHILQRGDLLTVRGITKHYCVSFDRVSIPQLIAFHKPIGYVCSRQDPYNKTIYEILPSTFHYYHYIGRLDKESTGLVLLTNEQSLVHTWTHPSHKIQKHYDVVLDIPFDKNDLITCMQGVRDAGDILRAKSLQCYGKKVHIVLEEGKNRHIRRMMAALGYAVVSLCRVSEGPIELGDIPVGQWRDVSSLLQTDVIKKL